MTSDEERCPSCGRELLYDGHVERCRESSFRGTDRCPMCGEQYESYLGHLRRDCSPR